MHPILLSFPPIASYGAMLVMAWAAGWWLARRRARSLGIPSWHIDWLTPLLLFSSALGARLAGHLSQMLSDGGANDRVLYGGLLLAISTAMVYGVVSRIPLGRIGDAFALSLPLVIAMIRGGCFLGGCCWGDLCVSPEHLAVVDDQAWRRQVQTMPTWCGHDWPLAVRYPVGSPAYYQHLTAGLLPPNADRSLPVHPVQLYEAAAALALLGLLLLVDRWLCRGGELFLLSGLGYCVIRFTCEWFRADSEPLRYGLTFSQLVSICCGSACLLLLGTRHLLARRGPGSRCVLCSASAVVDC